MIIDCISDLHGYHPKLDGGDLLIIAGDLTASDKIPQWHRFYKWLATLDYKKIIYIAGNHDGFLENCLPSQKVDDLFGEILEMKDNPKFEYLCDNGITYEGFKIWGSPWTPKYYDWHFMKSPKELETHWQSIPDDTEILITHGPPYHVLDLSVDRIKAGDKSLANRIKDLKNLKLHVFGHIHEAQGQKFIDGVRYINASHVDFLYNPVNAPIRINL